MTDPSIYIQLKEGDIQAYERLFALYYQPLCLFAKKTLNDNEKVRDIVQDVFVTLYAQRATLDIHTSLKSYLFKCVNNACLNELRQSKSHHQHHEVIKMESEFFSSHDEVAYSELQYYIQLTVEKLPDQCRKIFEMSRFEGRKNREIAEHLGLSLRTVETQISKALSILRTKLAKYLPFLILITLF